MDTALDFNGHHSLLHDTTIDTELGLLTPSWESDFDMTAFPHIYSEDLDENNTAAAASAGASTGASTSAETAAATGAAGASSSAHTVAPPSAASSPAYQRPNYYSHTMATIQGSPEYLQSEPVWPPPLVAGMVPQLAPQATPSLVSWGSSRRSTLGTMSTDAEASGPLASLSENYYQLQPQQQTYGFAPQFGEPSLLPPARWGAPTAATSALGTYYGSMSSLQSLDSMGSTEQPLSSSFTYGSSMPPAPVRERALSIDARPKRSSRRSSKKSMSSPSSPSRDHYSSSSRNSSVPSESAECNADVVNEYAWIQIPSMTPELKDQILAVGMDKIASNPRNDQLPTAEAVNKTLDLFGQHNVVTKLHILQMLWGQLLHTTAADYKPPKMTFRETLDGIQLLLQTSNGADEPRADIINPYLTSLAHCSILRNQLCRTRADVAQNADKRPHNSWFLYRGAQMSRGAILSLTQHLPDDLGALQLIESDLVAGRNVEHYRAQYPDPRDNKVDLTAMGYVVSYMWAVESEQLKNTLTDFSRVEHEHKLRVFPGYKYTPRRPSKRAGNYSS